MNARKRSQQRAEHSSGISGQSLGPGGIQPFSPVDLDGIVCIGLLKQPKLTGEVRIPAEHVGLEVEFHASSVQIGRADQEELSIDCEGLGMKETTGEVTDLHTRLHQILVVASTGQRDQPGIISLRKDECRLDTTPGGRMHGRFGGDIGYEVGRRENDFIGSHMEA